MIFGSYGASMSGSTVRRRFMTSATYFEGYLTPSSARMRSTMSKTSSTPTRSGTAQPDIALQQNNTWHPSRGIVFYHSSAGESRGFTSLQDHPPSSRKLTDHTSFSKSASPNSESPITTLNSKTTELEVHDVRRQSIQIAPELETLKSSPLPTKLKIAKGADADPTYDELPKSTTSFKMTEELFRAAKTANPGTIKSFWSHQLYRGPLVDGQTKKPTIHYCKSKFTTERVLEAYFMDQKVVGFDIEWNPAAPKHGGTRHNVSLVQIASAERILLCHLALYPKSESALLASPLLKQLMEDPNVTKVGVAIKADCTRLRTFLGINAQGLFELSHLYKLVKYSNSKDYDLINKSLVSLATQVQEHLHLPLFKGGDVRSSNWSKKLDLQQILYAAADSYAAVQLYHTMEFKRELLEPTPPRPFHAELNLPIRVAMDDEIDEGAGKSEEADTDDLPIHPLSTERSTAKQTSNLALDINTQVNPLKSSSFLPINLSATLWNSKLSASSTQD